MWKVALWHLQLWLWQCLRQFLRQLTMSTMMCVVKKWINEWLDCDRGIMSIRNTVSGEVASVVRKIFVMLWACGEFPSTVLSRWKGPTRLCRELECFWQQILADVEVELLASVVRKIFVMLWACGGLDVHSAKSRNSSGKPCQLSDRFEIRDKGSENDKCRVPRSTMWIWVEIVDGLSHEW